MKTLFIIVSMIAFSYLALQTSYAKSYIASFTQKIDVKLGGTQAEINTSKEFINKINALEMQSAHDREMYTQRISALEKNVKALKQQQSDIVQSRNDEKILQAHAMLENSDLHDTFDLSIKEESVRLSQQKLDDESELFERQSMQPVDVDMYKEQITQQQKRLQQQAVLRSLSQKMELASLSSLTK